MSAEVESGHDGVLQDDNLEGLNGGAQESEDDGDLFGDDDEEPSQHNEAPRKLDDSELDSGDDDNRQDRVAATVEDDEAMYQEDKQLKFIDADIARLNLPQGDELYLLNMPDFLGVKHENFDPATFQPPTKPHDRRDTTQDTDKKFSPFSTANTSMYWRRDPKDQEKIQSNARLVRWSDGSFTMQLASKPTEQYRVSTTAMRPGWPKKQSGPQHQDYDPNKETNNFLVAAHNSIGVDLQIVAPIDASMKIQPTGDTADEAELQLRQSIAEVAQQFEAPTTFRSVRDDPEKAKRAAEQFEKEKAKAERRREAAIDKQTNRRDKVLGRSGIGRSSGLTAAGLEDDMPTARGSKTKSNRRRTSNRHGDIYSDDEDDDNYGRRGKENEYDREDGFVADSDEEPETYEDDEREAVSEEDDDPDRDDLEIEGRETVMKGRTRGGARDDGGGVGGGVGKEKAPKRKDDDEDAEAEEDPEAQPSVSRKKRPRLVVDEDDDE